MVHARDRKADIYFSGEGGDIVIGSSFYYLIDLFKQGKWKTFYNHSIGWGKIMRKSPWSLIRASIMKSLGLNFYSNKRHPLSTRSNLSDWLNFL